MEYLYKYTSLSSLIFILKNREIRLNPLPTMDDQEEKLVADLSDYAKYCFISSWTNCTEEKISLWNMYTRDMTGIRIRLRKNPFEIYKYVIDDNINDFHVNGSQGTYIPKEWFENMNSHLFITPTLNDFLIDVEYTDSEELIKPSILSYKDDSTNIALKILGKYKRSEWHFQDEVRYRIIFLPVSLNERNNFELIAKSLSEAKDLPFDSVNFRIRKECFDEIEIMTGPKMSVGDKEILKLMVKEYCPKATIIPSKFTGKIL